jgi:hypothetical protein
MGAVIVLELVIILAFIRVKPVITTEPNSLYFFQAAGCYIHQVVLAQLN